MRRQRYQVGQEKIVIIGHTELMTYLVASDDYVQEHVQDTVNVKIKMIRPRRSKGYILLTLTLWFVLLDNDRI